MISDDGIDRGNTRKSWPAPVLRRDDRTPALGPGLGPSSKLTRSGLPDAYAFLRPKADPTKTPWEGDDEQAERPCDVPYADAMGLPSYRVLPPYVASFGSDLPGIDRYEAGMLMGMSLEAGMLHQFLRRTDAGALDRCCHRVDECQGLLQDAGMPSSWYDGFGQGENQILDLLKQAGAAKGGKFGPTTEKAIRDGFVGIRSHATDSTKWDPFNKTKTASFAILKSLTNGPAYTWNKPASPEQQSLQKIWNALEAHMNDQGGTFSFISDAVSSVGGAIGSVGKGVVSVAKGIATPVASLVASPIRLASDIASGKNVFTSLSDTVKRDLASAKSVAPYVQAVISVVPGVGQGVNAAIAAGSALAQGQNITSALVSGLKNALPGGPLAAQAFDTAYAVARGQNVTEAALQALVNQAPGGEIAKKAMQTAIAVAKGQNLQQAAIGAVNGALLDKVGAPAVVKDAISDLAAGKSVTDIAARAAGTTMANFSPLATGPLSSVGPRMINTVAAALPSILPQDAQMVAKTLLNNPALRSLPIEEIARRTGVSTNTVRDGMAAVLQTVQKSGGSSIPSLTQAKNIASRIPIGASFDSALARFGSRAAPRAYSHNAQVMNASASKLRKAGSVFYALGARGLDAGALDPKSMATIRQGSSGDAVVQWQKILGITADGKFGPNTAAATIAFQKSKGLTPDGIVGPATWTAGLVQVVSSTPTPTPMGAPTPPTMPPPATSAPILAGVMPTIRRGSTGAAVTQWQAFLQIPQDGQFGPQTEDATKSFQTKNALVADGIVGPKTWEKAMGGTAAPPIGGSPGPSTGPVLIPPITIPGPMGPITTPPITLPPGFPGVPGAPSSSPPIVTAPPPGMPPGPPVIVAPPIISTGSGASKGSGLLVPVAVGLGILVFAMSGSRKKLV